MIIGFKRHLPKTDLDSINVYMRDDVHVLISIFLAFICPRVIVFFFFSRHTRALWRIRISTNHLYAYLFHRVYAIGLSWELLVDSFGINGWIKKITSKVIKSSKTNQIVNLIYSYLVNAEVIYLFGPHVWSVVHRYSAFQYVLYLDFLQVIAFFLLSSVAYLAS